MLKKGDTNDGALLSVAAEPGTIGRELVDALRAEGVDVGSTPGVMLKESLDGGGGVFDAGFHFVLDNLVRGILLAAGASIWTEVGKRLRQPLSRVRKVVLEKMALLNDSFLRYTFRLGRDTLTYEIPAVDREKAIRAIDDDLEIVGYLPPPDNIRFWILGRWTTPSTYYAALKRHIRGDISVPSLDARWGGKVAFACKACSGLVLDVAGLSRSEQDHILVVVRAAFPGQTAGFQDPPTDLHIDPAGPKG